MRRRKLAACLVLALSVLVLTAGTSSPLQTQIASVGPYRVLLSFYSLPRVAQELQMTVGPDTPGETLRFPQALLKPGPGTDANVIRAAISPTGDQVDVYNVNVTPPARGTWLLNLTVSGSQGTYNASISMNVQGPPAIPTWLGWTIGMLPIPFILAFIWMQVRWRRRIKRHAT